VIKVKLREKPGRHIQLYYVDPYSGKEVTKSSKTLVRAKAERAAAAWEIEIETKGPVKSSSSSWESFRQRFEQKQLVHMKTLTRRSYITALNAFEKHVGRPRSIAMISPLTMTDYSSAMLTSGLAPHTVAKNLRHVKAMLSWGVDQGLIHRVPKVKMPKLSGHGMKGRPLTLWEVIRLLRAAKDVRPGDYAELQKAIKLLWLSGLRIQEAIKLSWNMPPVRVDFDGKFPKLVFHGSGQKSGNSEIVPLTPDCARFLGKLRQKTGRVLNCVTRLEREISQCGELAEIVVNSNGKFASAHDLRRTFGTRWALKVLPQVLRTLMRHSDIKTTLDYYVDMRADDIAETIYKSVPKSVPTESTPFTKTDQKTSKKPR
jgi:integrase